MADDRPLIPPDAGGEETKNGAGDGLPNGGTDARISQPSTDSVHIPVAGFRAYATVVILFTVNLLNYVDRYTVAGKNVMRSSFVFVFFLFDSHGVTATSLLTNSCTKKLFI